MHRFKSSKVPHVSRTIVKFDDMDQSTLANICRVAAERFKDHAKEFSKLIDYKPKPYQPGDTEIDGTPHGEAARRLAEQFDRQAEEALTYAAMFNEVDGIPDMVMDVDDEEEAA